MQNKPLSNLQHQPRLFEGLRPADLKGMISHKFTVDQYNSKMGNDDEIIVVAFRATDKFPAIDLMDFIEKGYPFVLDADTSSGEERDGDYAVFVEFERNDKVPEQLEELLRGVSQLCGLTHWRFRFFKDTLSHEFSKEEFAKIVPLTPLEYTARIKNQKISDVSEMFNQGSTRIIDVDKNFNVTVSRPFAENLTFKIENMGLYEDMKSQLTGGIQLDKDATSQVAYLEKFLGNYEIHKIDNKFLIRNKNLATIIVKDTW